MKKILNTIPLPISALMLSFATLRNVFLDIPTLSNIFGIITLVIFALVLLKIIITFDSFKTDMANPVIASVFATFGMGTIVLSTHLKPISATLGLAFWVVGVIIFIINAAYVFLRFIIKTKKILPSHYVTFVGIVVAAVTSPAHGLQNISFIIFIAGFALFFILTPFIFKNLFKADYLPKPAMPIKVIVAAPLSLCLAGYISSAANLNIIFASVLLLFSFLFTLLGCYFLLTSIKKEFNPAYASYTFPLVISSLAMKNMVGISKDLPFNGLVSILATTEMLIATAVVIFVLALYIINCLKVIGKK